MADCDDSSQGCTDLVAHVREHRGFHAAGLLGLQLRELRLLFRFLWPPGPPLPLGNAGEDNDLAPSCPF